MRHSYSRRCHYDRRLPDLFPVRGLSNSARAINGWHQNFGWALPILIGVHVAAALLHLFYYRDGVMQRMLPVAGKYAKPAIG